MIHLTISQIIYMINAKHYCRYNVTMAITTATKTKTMKTCTQVKTRGYSRCSHRKGRFVGMVRSQYWNRFSVAQSMYAFFTSSTGPSASTMINTSSS